MGSSIVACSASPPFGVDRAHRLELRTCIGAGWPFGLAAIIVGVLGLCVLRHCLEARFGPTFGVGKLPPCVRQIDGMHGLRNEEEEAITSSRPIPSAFRPRGAQSCVWNRNVMLAANIDRESSFEHLNRETDWKFAAHTIAVRRQRDGNYNLRVRERNCIHRLRDIEAILCGSSADHRPTCF